MFAGCECGFRQKPPRRNMMASRHILSRRSRMRLYHVIFMAQIAGIAGLIGAAVFYW